MPHKLFIFAYETGPLGYLISTRKALSVLMAYKIRDSRFQLFLLEWTGILLAVLGAGICGFILMPMLVALGVVAPALCFFGMILWITFGDIFLKFALEDERFYNMATETHALSVFEDTEFSLPQPGN